MNIWSIMSTDNSCESIFQKFFTKEENDLPTSYTNNYNLNLDSDFSLLMVITYEIEDICCITTWQSFERAWRDT